MNPFIAKDDGKYVLFSITFAVVPYVGTWIEISITSSWSSSLSVVPYVGTWIEISIMLMTLLYIKGRSLRGNVDRNVGAVIAILTMVLSFPTWERG